MAISFKNSTQNTGAVTLNVNTLGAKPIVKSNGNALSSGNLKAGSIYTVRYNATTGNFILQGEGGEYGTVIASDVRSTKNFGTEDGLKQGTLDLSNLTPSNIKSGVTIDGVVGNVIPPATLIVGDYIFAMSSNDNNYISGKTPPVMVKSIKVNNAGSIRVKYRARRRNSTIVGTSQIYINGVPAGIERLNPATTPGTLYTEDFNDIKIGDVIAIYLSKSSDDNYIFDVSDFTLFCANNQITNIIGGV